MKTFSRNFIASFSLAAMTLSGLFAQMEGNAGPFAGEGKIILTSGDTLEGRVNWRMKYIENNPVEIKFVPQTGPSAIYNASDLREVIVYSSDFAGSDMPVQDYVSLPSVKKGEPVLYHRMIDGKVQVFQNRSSMVSTKEVTETTSEFVGIGFEYTIGKGLYIGPEFIESTRVLESKTHFSSYFISKNNAPLVKVEKSNFEALFPELFGDCPAMQQEITKNPDLRKFKNFMILAEVYNHLCE